MEITAHRKLSLVTTQIIKLVADGIRIMILHTLAILTQQNTIIVGSKFENKKMF